MVPAELRPGRIQDEAAAAARAATEAFAAESGANTATDELPEWLALAAKLPASRGDRAMRGQLFDGMLSEDGKGMLTIDHLERELLSALGVPSDSALAEACAPAISRAIETSKDMRGGAEQDTVDRADFRLAIAYLRRYFELLALYGIKGPSDARQLDADAFEAAIPTLGEWGVQLEEPAAAFAKIPGHRNGNVPFDAFCDWALRRGLEPLVADADEEGFGFATRSAKAAEAPARSPSPPAKRSPSPVKKSEATTNGTRSPSPAKRSPSPAKKAAAEVGDSPANGSATTPAAKAAKSPKSKAAAEAESPSVLKLTLPPAGLALKEDTSALAAHLTELTEETGRTPRSRGYTRYLAGMQRLQALGAVPSPSKA